MRKLVLLSTLFGASLVALLYAAPAQAQATRTWVSGVGDDVNPCSRTAPCKTYAGAISKTAAGGEINCLDPGGFGALTITKSISIVCDYTEGGVLAAAVTGFTINAASGNIITLKGQDIECVGTGIHGINIVNADVVVHVHKTQIRNCRGGGNGITVATTSGTTELYVVDSYITDNGNSPTTGGILIRPTGSGSANVTVNRSQFENNSLGIRADTSATSGTIRGIVRDSLVAGNANNGITAVSTATVSTLMVDHASIVGNNFGLVVNGSNASLLVTNSSVTANGTGLFVNGTGQILSYKTNAVNNNLAADGAFTNFIVPE